MVEVIRGDILSKDEMKRRGIMLITTERGGLEFRAPTYINTIAQILIEKGFLEDKGYWDACDYLDLKNSVYGFLNAKTMASIFFEQGSNLKKSHAQYAYSIASKNLGKNTEKIIIRAIECKPDRHELDNIAVVDAYRRSFESLGVAMAIAKKAVGELIEKELEYVS